MTTTDGLDKYEIGTLTELAKWQKGGDPPYPEASNHHWWLGSCCNQLNRLVKAGYLELVDKFFVVTEAGMRRVAEEKTK